MIMRSDWRGEGRNTSAPKRAISKRDGAHRHHFNGAAGQAECHGPDGAFAHPVDHIVQGGEHYALWLVVAKQHFAHVTRAVCRRIAGGVLVPIGQYFPFNIWGN